MSHFFAKISRDNYYPILFFITIILITPAQIEVSEIGYSPSLLTFIFNILFENNFSTRILRPLVLSILSYSIFLVGYFIVKRKFF